jgi:signal transduction histidine kinase/ligand-binding sensor domain-containing protein
VQFSSSAQIIPTQQFKRCPVKTINYEQGLLNNGTTNIITDALGFTWVSTQTGMQRYNGYVLKKINPVINNDTISINSPVYFFAMQNGSIWISCKKGVIAYDPYTNTFKKIISEQNPGNLNFFIVPLKETNEGVWCMKEKKGIVIYSNKGTILTTQNFDNINIILKQQDILINTIFTSNNHYIFLYDGKDRVIQLNIHTRQLNYINTGSLYSLTCNQSNLYVITNTSLEDLSLQNGRIAGKLMFKETFNGNINYTSIFFTNNNQLLVGLNNHLYEFDTSLIYKKEITNLSRNPVVPVGVISVIYADQYQRIWLLTNDDIKRIQNVDIAFEHFIYANEKNNFVRSIYYDEKKNLLLAGCYNGGIQLYDTLGNALWQRALVSDTVKDISGIDKLTDDEYLVITIGRGWYILNLSSKQIRSFNLSGAFENMLHTHLSNFCNNIQRIDDSTIFITTSTNVFSCVFHNNTIESVQPLLPFASNITNRIACFIYTSDKTLWAGNLTGMIYRLDKNNALRTIHIPENYLIRSFAEDASHNVWVGADKGLYVYSSAGQLIKKITTESGLLNDCIYAMLPMDNKPAVFASSNLGLSYVSLNGNLTNYTKESGLQENEFNTQSSIKTTTGKFYFGGVNGITSFYPAALSILRDSPVLNITSLVVNDSLYNSSSGIWKGDTIELKHWQNHIQIDFAALGLLNANEYEYKYRLTGFEENWQTTHQPTGIKYILEPGKYVLEISCRPVLSSGSIFIKKIVVIIHSPWWKTWWFKALLILFGVGIVIFPVQQYNRRKYLQRIRVLEMQHEIQHERERISRDLHDNLGAYAAAIASNIDAIKNSQYVSDINFLHRLQNNSQSIINQLNNTIWALNKEAISLTAISDRFKIFLQKIQPNYSQVDITIKETITHDQTLSPANALHLFRIMQEAVNNALRHSKCQNIFIRISSSESWEICINDDGKGIPDLDEKLITGNGLRNIKLRCAEAGWIVTWQNAIPNGTELVIYPALL